MKKILIAVGMLIGLSLKAHASDFDYTGNFARAINGPNDWFPNTSGASMAGGEPGQDLFAIAQQFSISQDTQLTDLNVAATIFPTIPGTTAITYQLYTGSSNIVEGTLSHNPIPDQTALALSAAPISLTETAQQNQNNITQQINGQIPFSYDLKQGDYWLVERTTPGPSVELSTTYDAAQSPIGTAVVPEPPSVWLMLFGLAGALMLRLIGHFPLYMAYLSIDPRMYEEGNFHETHPCIVDFNRRACRPVVGFRLKAPPQRRS